MIAVRFGWFSLFVVSVFSCNRLTERGRVGQSWVGGVFVWLFSRFDWRLLGNPK